MIFFLCNFRHCFNIQRPWSKVLWWHRLLLPLSKHKIQLFSVRESVRKLPTIFSQYSFLRMDKMFPCCPLSIFCTGLYHYLAFKKWVFWVYAQQLTFDPLTYLSFVSICYRKACVYFKNVMSSLTHFDLPWVIWS